MEAEVKSVVFSFHCVKDGAFSGEGISLQEKIEENMQFGIQMGMPGDMARNTCEALSPQLKRWREG